MAAVVQIGTAAGALRTVAASVIVVLVGACFMQEAGASDARAPTLPAVFEQEAAGSSEPDPRVKQYLAPKRIVWTSGIDGVHRKSIERLLTAGHGQADLASKHLAVLRSDADRRPAILLDFGREVHGGLHLVTGMWQDKKPIRVRVRFGESVSEAMAEIGGSANATNDHAIRDSIVQLPWLGEIEIGETGFRFVRIDVLDPNVELLLQAVQAAFVYRDLPYLGSFRSSDERLNRIWLTGAYTVHLNMQRFLWDGIKRDRLVWMGDMHPEVMTINSVFGHDRIVPRSLDLVRDATPLPDYMNGISSYSMWWILVQRDWYLYHGDLAYLRQQHAYLSGLVDLLIAKIHDGREQLDGWRFLDWSTEGNRDAVNAGLQALMVLSLDAAAELGAELGDSALAAKAGAAVNQLRTHAPDAGGYKPATALLALADMMPTTRANQVLSAGGAKGFSTFYGYYILQAKAKARDYTGALHDIRNYWGGMLDLGATTFWEDFDLDWAKNAGRIDELPSPRRIDLHASYGKHAFKGLRMSLAHGWASGATAWLTQHVLGVCVVEPGATTLAIRPHLGDLSFVEGSVPTPHGIVRIKHRKDDAGHVISSVDAPEGVRVLPQDAAAQVSHHETSPRCAW